MIQISAQLFKEAGKILKRLPFAKSSLPVLSHVEMRANGETATLAVTNLNLRSGSSGQARRAFIKSGNTTYP